VASAVKDRAAGPYVPVPVGDGTTHRPIVRSQAMAIEDAAHAVDAAAFGHAFDQWLEPIYAFVARRVGDREASESVTARTFERAVESLATGSVRLDEIGGFLLRVAASAVLDHARRERRHLPPGVRATDLDEDGDAEAALWLADGAAARAFAAAIDGIELRRAVAGLDDPEVRVLLLRYLDGLDAGGMAAVLGGPSDLASLALHRALATLQPSVLAADPHVA
jgi:RNA polymerase sigma-70 factor, ECF subfamily